jgi:hypothetical protein
MRNYRGLKPTAKLKPSLRDEEVSAFRVKVWVMTSLEKAGLETTVAAATAD